MCSSDLYLEQEYYRENNINLTCCLNHACDQRVWLEGGDDNIKVDHALILHRWNFLGEARDQLERHKTRFPQLNKYLLLKPKWGIDFALEYYNDDDFMEIIHFENDYSSYDKAQEEIKKFEVKIFNTDWKDFVKNLMSKSDEWRHLKGMAQNDWKANFWGINKAETTLKVI